VMRRWTTLPLRQRLTLVFAVGTAVTLAAFGVFVYLRTAADLLDTVEAGLRSRAAILVVDARNSGPASVDVGSGLIEPDEAFAQDVLRIAPHTLYNWRNRPQSRPLRKDMQRELNPHPRERT